MKQIGKQQRRIKEVYGKSSTHYTYIANYLRVNYCD